MSPEELRPVRRGAEAFDVVVLDFGLPDLDGVHVIRAARACPAVPAVVVFTGYHRLKDDAEEAGCDAFILKPDVDELLDTPHAIVPARAVVRREEKRHG